MISSKVLIIGIWLVGVALSTMMVVLIPEYDPGMSILRGYFGLKIVLGVIIAVSGLVTLFATEGKRK